MYAYKHGMKMGYKRQNMYAHVGTYNEWSAQVFYLHGKSQ